MHKSIITTFLVLVLASGFFSTIASASSSIVCGPPSSGYDSTFYVRTLTSTGVPEANARVTIFFSCGYNTANESAITNATGYTAIAYYGSPSGVMVFTGFSVPVTYGAPGLPPTPTGISINIVFTSGNVSGVNSYAAPAGTYKVVTVSDHSTVGSGGGGGGSSCCGTGHGGGPFPK